MVICPITNSTDVQLEKSISCRSIIDAYEKILGIDVRIYFKQIDYIYIYRCLSTGFRFYYPFNVAGDAKFYNSLLKLPWYSSSWKWEHQIASEIIDPGSRILEIGCSDGTFIERMSSKDCDIVGLELNDTHINNCVAKGLNVLNETIEKHAENNNKVYDIVCSFQVLEHIPNVNNVIINSLRVLKNDGRMIISVPNNSSFIRLDEKNVINMPPHHMGLWDEKSLKKLEQVFPIKLVRLRFEPLQKYHHIWFFTTWTEHIRTRRGAAGKIFAWVLRLKLVRFCAMVGIALFSNLIKGHSVLVEYTKVSPN